MDVRFVLLWLKVGWILEVAFEASHEWYEGSRVSKSMVRCGCEVDHILNLNLVLDYKCLFVYSSTANQRDRPHRRTERSKALLQSHGSDIRQYNMTHSAFSQAKAGHWNVQIHVQVAQNVEQRLGQEGGQKIHRSSALVVPLVFFRFRFVYSFVAFRRELNYRELLSVPKSDWYKVLTPFDVAQNRKAEFLIVSEMTPS